MATEQKEQSKVCEEKLDPQEEEVKEEEEPKWCRVPSITLPTSTFRNSDVYQSEREMNEAIRNGTFELRKTMALKNGRLFFLCHNK